MNDLPEQQNAAAAGAAPGTIAFDPAGLAGDGLTYAILSQPSEGWAINNHDGTFFFDPVMDFRNLGADETRKVSVTYQVSDGQGAMQTATANLVVTGRSGEPPLVELSGHVRGGGDSVPEPQPAPPREPGFITETTEESAFPEESLADSAADAADDLGAIELVDIEPPAQEAEETPPDQPLGAWPGGMAVGDQQRRVEDSLTEDGPEPAAAVVPEPQVRAAEASIFDAPSPFAQDMADEPAVQDNPIDSMAGTDDAGTPDGMGSGSVFGGNAEPAPVEPAPVEPAFGGSEMAEMPTPVVEESNGAETGMAADTTFFEDAQPPADRIGDAAPAAPEPPDSPDPIGRADYQSDQFPLSPAAEEAMEPPVEPVHDIPSQEAPMPATIDIAEPDPTPTDPVSSTGAAEAAMEPAATPVHETPSQDAPRPDLEPESHSDSFTDDMADAMPATFDMAEPDPMPTGPAAPPPDAAVEAPDGGAKGFAYADVTASGQVGYRILSQPIEGRVEDRGDGTFTFEPGPPLLDMAIGEMCQVDFTYRVEIDGQEADCMKATVTVIGTSDGPEPDAVSFGPGEAGDSLDRAASDFAPTPAMSEAAPETAETPLPVGPADPAGTPETPEAGFEETAAPLPLGPADDRPEDGSAGFAPLAEADTSDEMPPGTEPWPTLDPAVETSIRKALNAGQGGSTTPEPTSPVAEMAAEHGTDVPDSIPAFLAGEPETEAAESPARDTIAGADKGALDAQDPVEKDGSDEPQFFEDDLEIGPSAAESDADSETPAFGVSETEDRPDMNGAAAAAGPEAFEEVGSIEDEAATGAEEAVAYMEDAPGFPDADEASGADDFAASGTQDGVLDEPLAAFDDPLEASPDQPAASPAPEPEPDAEFDLAAAYLKAQGADLSEPVVETPPAQVSDPTAVEESAFSRESETDGAADGLQMFDGDSPFEERPEKPAPVVEPAAAGGPAPEGQGGRDLLPGVTAADVLKSVVGGSEGVADDDLEEGDRCDTLHVDGVNGGPGVGGWDLELTEGSIVETHSEYMVLSSGAAGAVVLDGDVGRIKFEGIERIAW